MPNIYLSPSLQEWNPYVDGGNEEYYMNLIADAMEPYLKSSGINFTRNSPDMTLRQAINQTGELRSIIIPQAPRVRGLPRPWRRIIPSFIQTLTA